MSMSIIDNRIFYKKKRVLVTGHTGFKGAWLVMILRYLGADVLGYALEPVENSLYKEIGGDSLVKSIEGDIRDRDRLIETIAGFRPDIIIHLAAYGFVNECYEDPRRAYSTNVMGSLNLLEGVRKCDSIKSVIMVSTDKVYANKGDGKTYCESDELGASGAYAASKTCMEFLIEDYKSSYLQTRERCVGIASVRASNVLAGGDHVRTRLIPSILEAVAENRTVELRNPWQTRPWQSVLDALDGYLTVGRYLYYEPEKYSGAWNIGPNKYGIKTVKWVLERIQKTFRGLEEKEGEKFAISESQTLGLDIEKALRELDWSPRLSTEEVIDNVVEFFKRTRKGEKPYNVCMNQIRRFYGEDDV